MNDSNPVIETENLCCRFRRVDAVSDLNLKVNSGSVHAFLGPNGAGKTTTVKATMGLIRPTGGKATVFGTLGHKLGRREFEKIGYVSENQEMYTWMTVKQLMKYCAPMYPTWDQPFCDQMLEQFNLPLDRKIKNLSRGMQMKASLISSLAYRPQLLVMDEPFSGLDPLVREEFIEGMLELTEQESWTIFISSHDIDEVERLADTVSVINEGRLAVSEEVESLQRRFRKIEVTTEGDAKIPDGLPTTWLRPKSVARTLEFVDSQFDATATVETVKSKLSGVSAVETHALTLKEIYLTLARGFAAKKAA